MDNAKHMRRALALARRGMGRTSPNPMVGAVLVKRGRVIAEAYHLKAGTPHAEALVLDEAGAKARGATLFVTLEPCCHSKKRTPPCADAIIASGVKNVLVAMKDPNPQVSGKGIRALERAGIRVACGLMEDEARELNIAYIKHITTGLPFVTLKTAMTLDGKIATPEGQSKWITGPEARGMVHRIRSASDALLSAIGTVKADDPEFTARIRGGQDPIRVIIDPDLEVADNARILSTPPHTIMVTKKGGEKALKLRAMGIGILQYKGALDLGWLMGELGKTGITSILAEGGASFNWHCLDEGIVDRVVFFVAPKIIGGSASVPSVGGDRFRKLEAAIMLDTIRTRRVGEDLMITADVKKKA